MYQDEPIRITKQHHSNIESINFQNNDFNAISEFGEETINFQNGSSSQEIKAVSMSNSRARFSEKVVSNKSAT